MIPPGATEGLRTGLSAGGETNVAAWERALSERDAVERYIDKILAKIPRAARVDREGLVNTALMAMVEAHPWWNEDAGTDLLTYSKRTVAAAVYRDVRNQLGIETISFEEVSEGFEPPSPSQPDPDSFDPDLDAPTGCAAPGCKNLLPKDRRADTVTCSDKCRKRLQGQSQDPEAVIGFSPWLPEIAPHARERWERIAVGTIQRLRSQVHQYETWLRGDLAKLAKDPEFLKWKEEADYHKEKETRALVRSPYEEQQ
jgi:hypothetical protein